MMVMTCELSLPKYYHRMRVRTPLKGRANFSISHSTSKSIIFRIHHALEILV
jgi:hypothetical protein